MQRRVRLRRGCEGSAGSELGLEIGSAATRSQNSEMLRVRSRCLRRVLVIRRQVGSSRQPHQRLRRRVGSSQPPRRSRQRSNLASGAGLTRYSRAAFETRRYDPVKVRERWNNLLCKLSFCEVPSFSAIRSLLMFLAFRCAHRDTSSFRRLHDSFLPALRLLRPQVALSTVRSSEHCTGERGTKCNKSCIVVSLTPPPCRISRDCP